MDHLQHLAVMAQECDHSARSLDGMAARQKVAQSAAARLSAKDSLRDAQMHRDRAEALRAAIVAMSTVPA